MWQTDVASLPFDLTITVPNSCTVSKLKVCTFALASVSLVCCSLNNFPCLLFLHFPPLLQDTLVPPRGGWVSSRPGLDLFCKKWRGGRVVTGVRSRRSESELTLGNLGKIATKRT